MKTDKFNYYQSEINKINAHCLYSPTFQIRDENGQTKWLNLNQESAEVLIKWLKRNYNLK